MPTISSPTLTMKSRRVFAPAAALILAAIIPATSFADVPLVSPLADRRASSAATPRVANRSSRRTPTRSSSR